MRDHLTRNFYRDEFACRCGCGYDAVDWRLVEGLQRLRDRCGPISINCGCRCAKHNAATPDASPNSQHLLGKAADIVVLGVKPADVAAMAAQLHEFADSGIGIYRTFTHLDVRRGRSRWTL